jgi:uroporphyrinogen-III decarboxylase
MNQRTEFLKMVKERSASGNVFFRPILMQFAAHQIGKIYSEFYLDHENLVAANIHCLKTFGMDAVGLISDPVRKAEAYGAECEYPDEMGLHCANSPIKTMADVEALTQPDVYASKRIRDRIEEAKMKPAR